jgi:hypothetical protein
MDWERHSTDQLEQQLIDDQTSISRLQARQLAVLEELDRRQIATADGSRSMSEWVAARLDLSQDTARSLVRTMRRTSDRPDLREALDSGVSFDRVEALSRILEPVGLLEHLDVGGVHREAALRVRVTTVMEQKSSDDRFLVVQPSLDQSWWKVWGGLDGYGGAIFDKVVSEHADALPRDEGTPTDSAWRRATALVELCVSENPPPAQVSVFVDTKHAVSTNGEAGVVLEAGPRVGRHALEAVLCDAVVEVIGRSEDGRYMDYGRRYRTAPDALKRALQHHYHRVCAIDGCNSRNRLQPHHDHHWVRDHGATNQDNLILLCWFHHHVAIHQQGLELYETPQGRIRLRRPAAIRGP